MRFGVGLIVAFVLALAGAQGLRAEVAEVTLAKQFGLLYHQITVMEDQKLIEKHAKAFGLDTLKVSFQQLGSTGAMTDAILSGSLNVASGGIPGFLLLWDRTKGEMKGIGGLTAYNSYLVTNNPNVKTLKDLTEKDRIALPVAKISPQALYLQMEAEKIWGEKQYTKLDAQTITRAHPDSLAALLSKNTEITGHYSTAPFQQRALREPGITKVTSGYQAMGPHTPTMMYVSAKFARENPKVTQALVNALKEATDIIKSDKKAAAELYLKINKGKETVEEIVAIFNDPETEITYVPRGTLKFAAFMQKIGLMKNKAATMDDLFLPIPEIVAGN